MTAHRVAVPAGMGTALVLAVIAGLAVQLSLSPSAATVARTPQPAARYQLAEVRRIDHIAVAQLRRAIHQLEGCVGVAAIRESARGMVAWRRCARWPLAHVTVSGRTNGAILYGLGRDLRPPACRALVVSRANGMRLLAADADELVRGLWDTSRAGRRATALGAGAIVRFMDRMRHDLAAGHLGPCRRGALSTRA